VDKSLSANFHELEATIDDVKKYTHSGDGYVHPKESFVKKLNELTVKSAERIVLHSNSEGWVEHLVAEHRNWRVQSRTYETQR
jgi:hypothetical protein